jgi:fumarylpyruvate hydrolase
VSYSHQPAPLITVPISGTDQTFPVHRVYCVGKNYAAHVREMGSTPDRDPPCFFMKPADAVSLDSKVPYPPGTTNYHYETELVLAIGKSGRNIPAGNALEHVYGYAIGFDMTRRDLQMASGGIGHPWDAGKGFDYSAPLSPIVPASTVGHLDHGRIALEVNDEVRQDADLSDLIWKSPEIVAALSKLFYLQPGDLIFTGTPAGVGPVVPGDRLVATIDGLGELAIEITPAI